VGCSFDPSSQLQDPATENDSGTADVPDSGTVETCDGQSWWNADFPMRRPLAVEQAPYEYTMRLVLDASTLPTAQELVSASLAAGQDLRVLRFDGSAWTELDRQILAFDSAGVEIRFRIQESGGFPGDSESYYLYYGNSSPGAPLEDLSRVYRRWHDFEGDAIGSDGSPAFSPLPAADWQVVDDGGNHVYLASGTSRHSAQLAGLEQEDGVFEARMKVTAPDFTNQNHNGLMIRANNFIPNEMDAYVAQQRGNEQVSAVVTYRTGSFVTTGTTLAGPIQPQEWYQLRAEFIGGNLDFYIDDALVISMTDAELLRTGLGLFGFTCDVIFDDVSVRDLLAPEPGVAAAAEQIYCPE
jgi:hypothetical protein